MARVRRNMISADGAGWAVTDYDGKPLFGRWATEDEATEHGYSGVYLLSGVDVVEVDEDGDRVYRAKPGDRCMILDGGRVEHVAPCRDGYATGTITDVRTGKVVQ